MSQDFIPEDNDHALVEITYELYQTLSNELTPAELVVISFHNKKRSETLKKLYQEKRDINKLINDVLNKKI